MTSLFSHSVFGPETRFVRVVVERGIEHAGPGQDAGLTYACPEAPPALGERVEVPLGRGNTRAAGIVIRVGGRELIEGIDPDRVKAILRKTGTGLPPGLVALGEWMASYYVCPLGMVFVSMMPAAVKKQIGRKRIVELTLAEPLPRPDDSRLASISARLRKSWALLAASEPAAFPATARAIAARTPGVSMAALKGFVEAGLMRQQAREHIGGNEEPVIAPVDSPPPPKLTDEQAAIVDGIAPHVGSYSAHLIQGVTGSGKTEVYLRLLDRLFAARPEAGAIILVPEIALTPQTSGRFLERFPGKVAVLHSGLTASQRHQQWAACAAGRVRLVVGARSAVFAPIRSLGLIVVDEEHDSSYKQDQLPRYHARDVAVKRASLEGCPVVMGSATPSLESWWNTRAGAGGPSGGTPAKYHLWTLARRATNAPMPHVEVVDLAEERRRRASQPGAAHDHHLHLIGPAMETALDRALSEGGQAILLLNRRGYANYICCTKAACGWTMRCEHCDATSVYHLHGALPAGGFVRCHHCQAETRLPRVCPLCSGRINTFGIGTQRVEQELERKFAAPHGLKIGSTLLRVDGDTMRSARDYFDAIDRFANGLVRVMLGTQMIAKGLDFPNVRLVGVVNADTAINLPDFRAAERTFQLVSQVAGRAGRGSIPGRVVVQTLRPDEPAIVFASRHDFEGFARAELTLRARASLPPVGRMARVVCRDVDLEKAHAAAAEVAAAIRDESDLLKAGSIRVRGPYPCPIARIAGHHRLAIDLIAPTRGAIQSVLGAVRARGLLKSDHHTAVDIDPIALL